MRPIFLFLFAIAVLVQAPVQAGPVLWQASVENTSIQRADVAALKRTRDGKPDAAFLRLHQSFIGIAQRGQAQVVFLGDSITAHWKRNKALFDREYGGYPAANFGIPGDRTQHVLWRVQNGEFDGFRPKVVVLMIGTNNAGVDGNPPEQVAAGIRKIIREIHVRSPKTKVLLLSIFPRGDSRADANNRQVNALIAQFHDGNRIHYLNIRNRFLSADGQVTRAIMPDYLHLSAKGYRIWADAIRAKLAQLAR